ncbi:MAG: DUF1501 domain-containing protein [Planctomycetota bacterium]
MRREDRRQFLARLGAGAFASAAMGSRIGPTLANTAEVGGTLGPIPHHRPRAKRVVFLFQSGAPSQLELIDYKPGLKKLHGSEFPPSVRDGQRLTLMTANQSSFPIVSPMFGFSQQGQSGRWWGDLTPHTAKIVDDLCVIKSMHTEAINHDPGITMFQTGSQIPGRPSMGSWVAWALGGFSKDLPPFVVLISQGSALRAAQPLFARLWGAGFLPSSHQGVKFRSQNDPVLYLQDPPGVSSAARRRMLNALRELNSRKAALSGDPEVGTRMGQYDLAHRMQNSVPELADLSKEPDSTFELYGQDARKPGTYASNCLMARRLLERGVRFVQLYHRGWDQHENLPADIQRQCRDTDQGSAALVMDLKRRGLLEDTLVIWGGEFGRTAFCQGRLTGSNYGRDHHPRAFSMWMAGAGVKAGTEYGKTDDFSYNIVENPVHVHDLQATILHLLGMDHERVTYRYLGRDFRLTDVAGKVVHDILT